jgi:ABC-type maltose transport system permease subunit
MSGLLLGSISSYAFVAATLLAAIPVAILLKEYSEGGE